MKNFNEKCAEYLGWEYKTKDEGYFDTKSWFNTAEEEVFVLCFDSDWNWVMIVLEAILEECYEEGDLEPYYIVTDAIPVLEDIKQAILNYFDNETN